MKPTFEKVVKQYIKLIYFFALRWGRKEDVDDMVQSTLLKAYESYDNFHFHSEGQLKSWLLTICRNTVIDKSRTKKMLTLDTEELDTTTQSEESELLDQTIKKDEIEGVVAKLETMEQSDQEIIRLRIFEEMSFDEIGSVFDISEPASKMKFYRAIKKLKKSI